MVGPRYFSIFAPLLEITNKKKIMNTLLFNPQFAILRASIEKQIISRFKEYYGVYDKRLNKPNIRSIKVSYIGSNRVFVETTYKRGMRCSHSYLVENEILDLLVNKNPNAILFNAIISLSKEDILRKAKRNNEKPFGYVIDYLKDVYNLPKMVGYDIAEKILEYFEIDNE